jgi:putative intracellular protease/amidase
MSVEIDVLDPNHAKRVAIVLSNPAVSKQTGWPIGFWWGELTHPYWEFSQHGYQIEIFSPEGGRLESDRVRIRRVAQGVLLEPLIADPAQWFEELDQFNSEPFMFKQRRPPATPKRKIF